MDLNSFYLIRTYYTFQRLSNFFNRKKWAWLINDHCAIHASDLENIPDYLVAISTASALVEQIHDRWAVTFCLFIEEPLVDFNPLQASLLHCLTTSLSCHVSFVFVENLSQCC